MNDYNKEVVDNIDRLNGKDGFTIKFTFFTVKIKNVINGVKNIFKRKGIK